MELSELVTQNNAEEGKWFPVILYGKKQNFALKIIGADSDEVVDMQRNLLKKIKGKGRDFENLDDEDIENLLDSKEDMVVSRIKGIKTIQWKHGKYEFVDNDPVTLDGEVVGENKKSYIKLLELIPALSNFVLDKSNERTNFLD